ncbi:transposase [Campylobacter rectus]|uniref:transposase n=1 Tax=Campylobacter rectus TaxID=203 RepID=UPI0036F40E30
MDESYFGSKRVRGKRGRGASGKQPVFLLRYARSCKQTVCLKEMAKFIPRLVKNRSANELIPILSEFLKESASYQ